MAFWTLYERFMYFQFSPCVYWDIFCYFKEINSPQK